MRDAHVAGAALVHLPANVPPWTGTAVGLEAGQAFTLFAEGRVVLSLAAGLWTSAPATGWNSWS